MIQLGEAGWFFAGARIVIRKLRPDTGEGEGDIQGVGINIFNYYLHRG